MNFAKFFRFNLWLTLVFVHMLFISPCNSTIGGSIKKILVQVAHTKCVPNDSSRCGIHTENECSGAWI